MKSILVVATLFVSSLSVFSQNTGTTEAKIKVEGICTMCKTRIEEAVNLSKGIKSADWDKDSEMLTVVYKTGKTTPEEIGAKLAKAGHDNQYAKATEEDYEKISGCCRYKTQHKH